MLQTVRKWTQINQGQLGEPFGSISGVIDPFWGLWMAPKSVRSNTPHPPSLVPNVQDSFEINIYSFLFIVQI